MNNMTALTCTFVKAYINKNYTNKVIEDKVSEMLLTKEEYENISNSFMNGINYFNKNFKGTKEEGLKWIVDNILSCSVIARTYYSEICLKKSIKFCTKQYLVFASGYDTYAYRNDDIKVFEIDKKEVIEDKIKRVVNAKLKLSNVNYIKCDLAKDNLKKILLNSSYNENTISFCSLLGISYYLTKKEFSNLIKNIASIICEGSTIVFDYPSINSTETSEIISSLASASNEKMKSMYSYQELEDILSSNGLLVYEHLNSKEMKVNYLDKVNKDIILDENVNYLLAVKKTNIINI